MEQDLTPRVQPQRVQPQRRNIRIDTENPEEIAELENIRRQIRYINRPRPMPILETLDLIGLENLLRLLQGAVPRQPLPEDPRQQLPEDLELQIQRNNQNMTLNEVRQELLDVYGYDANNYPTMYNNPISLENTLRNFRNMPNNPVNGGRKRKSKQRRTNRRRSNRKKY